MATLSIQIKKKIVGRTDFLIGFEMFLVSYFRRRFTLCFFVLYWFDLDC